ncbi:MAG TPA: DUF72 domain-containing protein [Chloroflexota bacterium]
MAGAHARQVPLRREAPPEHHARSRPEHPPTSAPTRSRRLAGRPGPLHRHDAPLGPKLLAIVAQLPPQWHWRPERLDVLGRFLEALPRDFQWAVEFRHRGRLNEDVFELMRAHEAAFVMQDLYYMPRQVEVTTADLAYIRLQGRRKDIVHMDAVQIDRDEALDEWAEVVRALAERSVRTVVVAANNHYQGHSPGTVAALQRRLGLPVSHPPAVAVAGPRLL